MALILSGSDGLSDVDGSAATPAIRGTDANTGIFFPAADVIAFSEGGVEAARLNSTGSLCVGSAFSGDAGTVTVSIGNPGTTAGGLQLWAGTSQEHYIQFGDTSSGAGTYSGAVSYTHASDALKFWTASTERARFNSTGAFVLAGGSTSANGIGITFPATQSASSDANTLDDYEEGTWTPIANNMSVSGTVTYAGTYIKIGRLVHVTMSISIASGGTFSSTRNTSYFSGLPFAVNGAYQSTCSMSSNSIVNAGIGMCYAGPVMYVPTASYVSGDSAGWVSGTYITTT